MTITLPTQCVGDSTLELTSDIELDYNENFSKIGNLKFSGKKVWENLEKNWFLSLNFLSDYSIRFNEPNVADGLGKFCHQHPQIVTNFISTTSLSSMELELGDFSEYFKVPFG